MRALTRLGTVMLLAACGTQGPMLTSDGGEPPGAPSVVGGGGNEVQTGTDAGGRGAAAGTRAGGDRSSTGQGGRSGLGGSAAGPTGDGSAGWTPDEACPLPECQLRVEAGAGVGGSSGAGASAAKGGAGVGKDAGSGGPADAAPGAGGSSGAGGSAAKGGAGVGKDAGEGGSAGGSCVSWNTKAQCEAAGCTALYGTPTDDFNDSVFVECITAAICTAATRCAFAPSQPGTCYQFGSGCLPTNWTSTNTCPLRYCPH